MDESKDIVFVLVMKSSADMATKYGIFYIYVWAGVTIIK